MLFIVTRGKEEIHYKNCFLFYTAIEGENGNIKIVFEL